jgi:hypothetical protein
MDPEKLPSFRARFLRIMAILISAVSLYVLSVGPVTCWHVSHQGLWEMFDTDILVDDETVARAAARQRWYSLIYGPVIWAKEETFLQKPLRSYLNWWGQRGLNANPQYNGTTRTPTR